MRIDDFESWLRVAHPRWSKNSYRLDLARAKALDHNYGDLDAAYDHDKLRSIRHDLETLTAEEDRQRIVAAEQRGEKRYKIVGWRKSYLATLHNYGRFREAYGMEPRHQD